MPLELTSCCCHTATRFSAHPKAESIFTITKVLGLNATLSLRKKWIKNAVASTNLNHINSGQYLSLQRPKFAMALKRQDLSIRSKSGAFHKERFLQTTRSPKVFRRPNVRPLFFPSSSIKHKYHILGPPET